MPWDDTLTSQINSLAGRWLFADSMMVFITNTGHFLLVAAVAIPWFSRNHRKENRLLAIQCGIATALSLAINQFILLFYHRLRPYEASLTKLMVEKSSDPSFPSDHATIATAICASLLFQRDKWVPAYLTFSILLCFSRVYVGTHYVSDVFGGVATGIVGVRLARKSRSIWINLAQKIARFPH